MTYDDTMREIESEDPRHHWTGVLCEGRSVLDLGGGDFGNARRLGYPATPDYWLENGATSVHVVDARADDIARFDDSRMTTQCVTICLASQVEHMIRKHKPQLVKCDIEGYEACLIGVSREVFEMPEAYAIETHSADLYDRSLKILERSGYEVLWVASHKHNSDVRVIYAERDDA